MISRYCKCSVSQCQTMRRPEVRGGYSSARRYSHSFLDSHICTEIRLERDNTCGGSTHDQCGVSNREKLLMIEEALP